MFLRLMTLAMVTLTQMCIYGTDAVARGYTYQIIKVAPHDGGTAVALNNNGMVLGNFGGSAYAAKGVFTWQAGTVTKYRRPSSHSMTGYGLNDLGVFVGSYRNAKENLRGFIYSGGKYTTLSFHAAGYTPSTVATVLNNDGVVAGYYSCGGHNPLEACGFGYSAGAYQDYMTFVPYAINQAGDMSGLFVITYEEFVTAALLTKSGNLQYVDGYGFPSHAGGLNENDTVVGELNEEMSGGFAYSNGVTTYFGAPTCIKTTEFTGINNAGDIVGACMDGSAPFVYQNGAFTNLNTVRGQVLQPIAINNHGQILANTAGGFAVLATPK